MITPTQQKGDGAQLAADQIRRIHSLYDKCTMLFYVHGTKHGTYGFTSHPKDAAIMYYRNICLFQFQNLVKGHILLVMTTARFRLLSTVTLKMIVKMIRTN